MEYNLGETIYYLRENKVHSAEVLSRTAVENANNKPSNAVQEKLFTPFGKARIQYGTSHGIIDESEAFASKVELLASL